MTKRIQRYPSLKAWRDARRIDQRTAARELGVSQAYYCRLERQEQHPRPEIAKAIIETTGVSLEALMGIAS